LFLGRYDYKITGEPVNPVNTTTAAPARKRRAATNTTSLQLLGGLYQFFVPPGSLSPGIVFVGFSLPELDINSTANYGFLSFADACRVWDEAKETWDTTSCTVTREFS
jgi:hypothetical protein